jgi:hypothetical protein
MASLLIIVSVFAHSSLVAGACSQYAVESSLGAKVFNNYLFQDFRYLSGPWHGNTVNESADGQIQEYDIASSNAYLSTPPFTNDWSIQTWSRAATTDNPVPMTNSANNVNIGMDTLPISLRSKLTSQALDDSAARSVGGGTMLSLITKRESSTQQTSAEIDSKFSSIFYASIRLEARITGAPGACVGLFLYESDTQETDIEILTSDSQEVFHATNQPSHDANGNPIPGATTVVTYPDQTSENGLQRDVSLEVLQLKRPTTTLATIAKPAATQAASTTATTQNGLWSEWHEYRIDWVAGQTDFYVDDVLVDSKTVGVPTKPMSWIMNIWSDGGSWSGEMKVGDSARLDIRWLELVYNTTSDAYSSTGSTCHISNGPNTVNNAALASSDGNSGSECDS